MGTEYGLMFREASQNQGGFSLLAYEMSGVYTIYLDVSKNLVDMEAFESMARVDLLEVEPPTLFSIGLNFCEIAIVQMDCAEKEQVERIKKRLQHLLVSL